MSVGSFVVKYLLNISKWSRNSRGVWEFKVDPAVLEMYSHTPVQAALLALSASKFVKSIKIALMNNIRKQPGSSGDNYH